MSAASSSRGALVGRSGNTLVVPTTEWMPTALEAPQPSTSLAVPPFSHLQNRSKSTRKPLRSSPLAGPAISDNRSVVSLNDKADNPRASWSPTIPQDLEGPLYVRSKSSLGLSRPVSMFSTSPRTSSSMNRLTTSPTPSPQRSIKRPSSAIYSPTETINISGLERGLLSTSQGSSGVGPGSSFVSGSSGPRSRASYMSTASAGPSTFSVPVVLEVPTEVVVNAETEGTRPQASVISSHPKSIPPVPVDNSWFTVDPYSVTPKFSRLGLAGSSVVMPVSAKDHKKRLSRGGSATSLRSNKSSTVSKGSAQRRDSTSAATSTRRKSTSSLATAETGKTGSNEDHTTSQAHKPEWLSIPPVQIRPRKQSRTHKKSASSMASSSPSPTETVISAASSASSLPLTTPHSGASLSVVSCTTACTSVRESEETVKEDRDPKPVSPSPMELESRLLKRKSVLARMKSWRKTPSQPPQRKQVASDAEPSFDNSADKRRALSIYSGAVPRADDELPVAGKDTGVAVGFEQPILSSGTNSVDIILNSLPKSCSEPAIRVLPGNEKRQRKTVSVRKIWNAITGWTSRT